MKKVDLRSYKRNLFAIILWPHGNVQPYRPIAIALDEQFIKVLLPLLADVEQD